MSKRSIKSRKSNTIKQDSHTHKLEIIKICNNYQNFLEFNKIDKLLESYGITIEYRVGIYSILLYNKFEYNEESKTWITPFFSEEEFVENYSDNDEVVFKILLDLINNNILTFEE